MDYSTIPQSIIKERDEICIPLGKGESVKKSLAKENIGYFMYHQLGLKPYAWQYMAFKEFRKQNKHQIWATSRQYLGKTTAIAMMALHSVVYNMYPSEGLHNRTVIGVISRTEEQSKKIIKDIRDLMYRGDEQISRITGGKITKFFDNMLSTTKSSANSKTEITLTNGCRIIALPPTDRVRGYTFSQLFCDEAAFFENDEFFLEIAFPTLSKTNGKMVLTSTPNGQKGFFFKVFDPFEQGEERQDFNKIWLYWKHIENPDEIEKVMVTKDMYYSTGRGIKFEQEYETKFTATVDTFLDSDKVDEGIDKSSTKLTQFDGKTDMGIDVGYVDARTVITISYIDKDKVSHLIYHYIYPQKNDLTLISDVQKLIPRFNVQRIIIDDCPASGHIIQRMKEIGLNVKPMSFKKDKVRKYGEFRAQLYKGKIKYYNLKDMIHEMKALQEEETLKSTRISKPQGGSDDIIDSFLMSLYYYIESNKGIRLWDVNEDVH